MGWLAEHRSQGAAHGRPFSRAFTLLNKVLDGSGPSA
jgi:hypothetical protein